MARAPNYQARTVASSGSLPSAVAAATTGSGELRIARTAPDTLLRHDISDEELELLSGSKRDGLAEFMWAMVALATGAAPAAMDALFKSYASESAPALGLLGLVQVLMLVVGIAMAISSLVLIKSRGKSNSNLVEAIRKRTPR